MSCTSDAVIENTTMSAAPAKKRSTQLNHHTRDSAKAATSAPNTTCTMSSASPMCLNRPSHATTSAPTTAPAPENAIM